jgi:hypothetical protein
MTSRGNPAWLELRARGYSDADIGRLLIKRRPRLGRTCRECGAAFVSYATALYCGPKCSDRAGHRPWLARRAAQRKAARLMRQAARAARDG